ncbi:hypothetical protein G6F32_005474 [Rhizopus arrhizus]|nr:hypothetical protein G6F32_005474 [Rhizopus arrhizus]
MSNNNRQSQAYQNRPYPSKNYPTDSQRSNLDQRARNYPNQSQYDPRMRHSQNQHSTESGQPSQRLHPKKEPTRPSKSRSLSVKVNPPWLLATLSHKNIPKDANIQKPTKNEIKSIIPKLMKGFRCNVPYAYHHRLVHASLSRPTEFVRQIPVPSIRYLKKESWPVYNKYIGPPLNRELLKRRCHQAADPSYKVPVPDRKEIISPYSRRPLPAREPGEIVSGDASRWRQSTTARSRYPEPSSSHTNVPQNTRKDGFKNDPEIMSFIADIKARSKNFAPNPDSAQASKETPSVKKALPVPPASQKPTTNTQRPIQRPAAAPPPPPPPTQSVAPTSTQVPSRSTPGSSQKPAAAPGTFKTPDRINRPRPTTESASTSRSDPVSRPPETIKKPDLASRPTTTTTTTTAAATTTTGDKRPQAAKPPLPPARAAPVASSSKAFGHQEKSVKPDLHKTKDKTIDKGKRRTSMPLDKTQKAMAIKELLEFEKASANRIPTTPMTRWSIKLIPRPRLIVRQRHPTSSFMKLAQRHANDIKSISSSNKTSAENRKTTKKSIPVKKSTSPLRKTSIEKSLTEKNFEDNFTKKHSIAQKQLDKKPTEKKLTEPTVRRPSESVEKFEQRPVEKKSAERRPVEKQSIEQRIHKVERSKLSEDTELEEGETISPSPSPPLQEERVKTSSSRLEKDTTRSSRDINITLPLNAPAESSKPQKRKAEESPEEEKAPKKTTSKIKDEPESQSSHSKHALSATAPKSNTMEQYKVFTFMFKKLAHTYKKRGDAESDPLKASFDHFHSFCNYIISYHYAELQKPNESPSQFSATWKSLFPFADSLLSKLKLQKEELLYGVCLRLVSMMRYHIFNRMQAETRVILAKQLAKEDKASSHKYLQMSSNLLDEYHKAINMFGTSELHFNYSVAARGFPTTFKEVCVDGNVIRGITIGGEAGVEVHPMFPFTFDASLLHAAITTKCIIDEAITVKKLAYKTIDDTFDFM